MKSKHLLSFWILIFSFTTAICQDISIPDDLKTIMPIDAKIIKGKFDNGLTYYIRQNKKPENRVELRLVVKAGSILEDDDQQGLAHFAEHMAFNGTKNFAKQKLVNYLESIGMRFGPDLNAYTSFDETVYMLQVPTDTLKIVEKAFQILEDWASAVTFDEEEIDKERGVVIEEWRLGQGASNRMREKQLPILLKDSRYAERMPIGKKEILETFKPETLLRFYSDWYRPDLMAVIAVGDFEVDWIESLINDHFSKLKNPDPVKERANYPVPDHQETLFALASDVEASGSSVTIYYKHDIEPEGTLADYRRQLVDILYNNILNQRLNELTKQAEPPFLYGYSSSSRFIGPKDVYLLGAGVKDNGLSTGLNALLTEAARMEQFGIVETELERQKISMLRSIERAYIERDKSESRGYAAEFIRNFLYDEPIPGIEYEYALFNKYVPDFTVEEVNRVAGKWIRDENRVIMTNTPEKEGLIQPTEESLELVFVEVQNSEITPYEDMVSNLPLLSESPTPAKIVESKEITSIGVTEWQLSNGIRVVLKPTDFKNDEILFTSYSPGGHSLVEDDAYIAGVTSSMISQQSGYGNFNLIELQKLLTGKVVRVSPFIGELYEGISGSASPKDLETLFQLIYLSVTSARYDSTAFQSIKSRYQGFLENREARPETAFQDTLQVTLSQYHLRSRPWSKETLDKMDLSKSFEIYKDRFTDFSDFTFFFVGNFDLETMEPFVKTYLGGLPSTQRKENWRDVGVRPPKGVIEKTVKKGLEEKSQVRLVFTGPFKWDRTDRYHMISMASALRIKLRKALREDLGGTYGVGVNAGTSHYPNEDYSISISFGCAPDRVDELTQEIFTQIDSLKSFGIDDETVTKVKEAQKRTREIDLKKNGFWLSILQFYYQHDIDPVSVLDFDERLKNLSASDMQKSAQKYFDLNNYVKVVLLPEDSGK
ncbi:insulinase family protein [candidate division KSB1 bacterium]|nr:insulinase family protein [candidate division KSB1 bacterium]